MPDRDKIVKAIDVCLGHGKCNDCSYHSGANYSDQNCRGRMLKDVLALLKEQKAVRPEREHSGGGTTWWNVCGNCKTAINPNDKFCHECGRAVKWDEP